MLEQAPIESIATAHERIGAKRRVVDSLPRRDASSLPGFQFITQETLPSAKTGFLAVRPDGTVDEFLIGLENPLDLLAMNYVQFVVIPTGGSRLRAIMEAQDLQPILAAAFGATEVEHA